MKKPKITEFKTFAQMMEMLPDEAGCRNYLEKILWNNIPVCPHCGEENKDHYKLKTKGEFKGLYKCKGCRERFTVTVGSIFEGSHAPLRKWFIAMFIFASHKKGISSHQLAKDIGVTQKTAWFMLHRIRFAFNNKPKVKFTGVTQMDETFIGGKSKNKHVDKRTAESQGRSVKDKTPIFGMVNNGGDVHLTVIPDTKAKTIKPIINEMVAKGSIVITDEWGAYNGLNKDYSHSVINHKNNEYVRGGFHTNNIENFWSLLKRGIYGIYHQTSPQHLHRYCNEFSHRYNTRKMKDSDRFDMALKNVDGRLTYKQLTAK
jgi:transposase-like protein